MKFTCDVVDIRAGCRTLGPLAFGVVLATSACVGDDDASSPSVTGTPSIESPTPTIPSTPVTTPEPTQPEEATEVPTPAPTPTPTPIPPRGELSESVEVYFDDFGVPHIYAQNEEDLFFMQGYVAAHQRFFQMELNRLEALGRKTEIYGASALTDDMLARSLKPIAHAEAELETFRTQRPREYAWVESYAAGVNAYIDDAIEGTNGAEFPDAIIELNYVPDYLTMEQMFAMDYLFAITLGPDPLLELTTTLLGLYLDGYVMMDILQLKPVEDACTVPDAERPIGAPPPSTTRASSQAPSRYLDTLPPELKAHLEEVLAQPGAREQLAEGIRRIRDVHLFDGYPGSNAWVVSGEHTESGYPLLANDPHMGADTPITLHQVHCNTTEAGGSLNFRGVVAAGGPGLILGHNERVGWGVTTSYFDTSDLYMEVPSGNGVRFGRDVIPYETWDEVFLIRQNDGSFTTEVRTLKRVPHHGPVLPSAELGLPESIVLSLKWAGEQPGSTLGTIFKFLVADTMDDVEKAMAQHRIGAGNFVFATVDGDIAYDGRTGLPEREAADPTVHPWLALPGTGGYEWVGWIDPERISHTVNPVSGVIVTANNDPSGHTLDNDPLNDGVYLGSTYSSGLRAKRIDTWLRGQITKAHPLTPEDMTQLQSDVESLLAQRLVRFLLMAAERRSDLLNSADKGALIEIENWDYQMSADSSGACIYAAWWPTLFQEIFQDDLLAALFEWWNGDYGNFFMRPLVYFLEETEDSIDAIESGDAQFPSISTVNYFDDLTTEPMETRDQQILEAYHRVVTLLMTELGPTPSEWRYDAYHTLTLNNLSSPWVSGLDRGPYPLDGYPYTVDCADSALMVNGQPPALLDVSKVGVMRTVMDFADGEINASIMTLGGQVDDGSSLHYNDQTDYWVNNETRPALYKRSSVTAEPEEVWNLPSGFPRVAR